MDQREAFEAFCKKTFLDGASQGSKTISREKGEKIKNVLKKHEIAVNYSPKFKHWVKQRSFHLLTTHH